MIKDLLRVADAFGDPKVSLTMHEALRAPLPHGGGVAAAMQHFGDQLEIVLRRIAPTVAAVDEMLPGFTAWLAETGFGDDRFMLDALLSLTDRLDRMPAPLRFQRNKLGTIRAGA